MNGLTLTFHDKHMEEQYTTNAFRAAYYPTKALCCAVGLLFGLLAATQPAYVDNIMNLAICVAGLACRALAHHMHDQQQARYMIGGMIALLSTLGSFPLYLRLQSQECEQSATESALYLHLAIACITMVYWRISAIPCRFCACVILAASYNLWQLTRHWPAARFWVFGTYASFILLGYAIERHLRASYVRHEQSPASSFSQGVGDGETTVAQPRLPVRMNRWSLEFDDAEYEARYATRVFRAGAVPFCVFFGTLMAFQVLLGAVYPATRNARAVDFASIALMLALRIYAHYMEDQQRARILTARIYSSVNLVNVVCVIWAMRAKGAPVSASSMVYAIGVPRPLSHTSFR